ncbi:MAG: enoyl-ACP reductase [Candidatus Margulisiibacteriota bacterium]|jgi:enoyl-[acyl-carrier protein] reductase I|nr:enoyl-ACP reductase [Candidatus Margulisiibacteriota bacterium]
MGIMQGKKGIIFGVSNKRGIGYAIAKKLFDEGADIAFTYAGDVMKDRVTPLAEAMNSQMIMNCDVSSDSDMDKVVEEFVKVYGKCDFIIHAVAFANREDLEGDFSNVSREGWNMALDVSAYSFVAISNKFKPHLNPDASLIALSYLGGERAVPNYNVMGVAKAALEASVRYLASEFGEIGVRVNAISAGPVKTLAAKGITGFDILLKVNAARAPMKRNVTLDEVGNAGLYLCSYLSSGVTGETHHVDCGYHSIATSREDAKIIGISA